MCGHYTQERVGHAAGHPKTRARESWGGGACWCVPCLARKEPEERGLAALFQEAYGTAKSLVPVTRSEQCLPLTAKPAQKANYRP